MIVYLIKSALSLSVILAIYQLLLGREKMPVFNRMYLIFGLLFSFLAPLVSFQLGSRVWAENALLEQIPTIVFGMIDEPANSYTESVLSTATIIKIGYALITSLFVFRFFKQLSFFFEETARHPTVAYRGATLVLLKRQSLPYTFLHYIYLDEAAYQRGEIEEELLTHELAHVQQWHSLDIILLGLLQSLFWWNPLLLVYKRAIQLNHEFLADDAVIQKHLKVPDYQYLLLKKVSSKNYQNLSSNFNYLVTKKRLKMMTRESSRSRAMGFAAMTIPLFLGLFLLVGNTGMAQNNADKSTIDFEAMKDNYFKHATIVYKTADDQKIYKAYQALNKEEKAKFLPPPPPPPTRKGETSKKMEPLAKGTLVYVTKDGKVIIDQSGEKIPPPPPPPPVHREKKSN